MKRMVLWMMLSLILPLGGAWSEEVFCRYQAGGETYYGQVYGNVVHQLNDAPWNGGVETGHSIMIKQVKLLHPSEPQKIFGLSGAYKENWTNGKIPFNTIRWFLKPPSAAASPNEDVILPVSLDTLLVETELVIVIGKHVKDASIEEAKEAIFGYTVGNDIVGDATSYHRIQGEPLDQEETLLSPGLKMGDGFAPYGPFIHRGVDWKNRLRTLTVTNPETGEKLVYEHNTSNLAYTPEKMVSDLSRVFSLDPGDVIFTATTEALPAQAGDIMEVGVEGLGKIVNKVKAAR